MNKDLNTNFLSHTSQHIYSSIQVCTWAEDNLGNLENLWSRISAMLWSFSTKCGKSYFVCYMLWVKELIFRVNEPFHAYESEIRCWGDRCFYLYISPYGSLQSNGISILFLYVMFLIASQDSLTIKASNSFLTLLHLSRLTRKISYMPTGSFHNK